MQKPLFLILILILLLTASCTNETVSDEDLQETLLQKKEALRRPKFGNVKAKPHKYNVLRPFTFNLEGLMGEEAIEMFLSYNPDELKEETHCIEVEGDYNFKVKATSNHKLTGELCFDTGILTLFSRKGAEKESTFRGIFKGQVHSMKGKWSNKAKTKDAEFSLHNSIQSIEENSLHLFALKLNEHLLKTKEFSGGKAGYDERGIFIEGIQDNNLIIKNFSPTTLKWSNIQETETSSSDYIETVDLWFYNNDKAFVIIIHSLKWEEETGKGEKETLHTEVWQYIDSKFINIFIDDAKNKNLSKKDCYAIEKDEIIQLHNNKTRDLWEWTY
jgi:hypothetical protein